MEIDPLEDFVAGEPASDAAASIASEKPPAVSPPAPVRLLSLDAYRGFTMLAMASGGLGLAAVAGQFPESGFWSSVGYHFSHAEWIGCAFWDLIQPSFMFMVGVSMAFSCANRAARGQSRRRMLAHAVFRAVFLTLLGVFLRSNGRPLTNWTFEDVVSQIGLGYVFLFLLWGRGFKVQLSAAGGILLGYWLLFALWPLPGADYDWAKVGVGSSWPHKLEGFAAHWNKNANPAHYFDVWLLNLFPRSEPFTANGGGYETLSFVPSLATMIFGLLAGEVLRLSWSAERKVGLLAGAGAAGLLLGELCGAIGLCPVVKRIWTPGWTFFSTGWTLLLLAGFYLVIDRWGLRRWAWPGVVVGMNSIAMYIMTWLFPGWIRQTVKTHLGADAFEIVGKPYSEFLQRTFSLVLLFLICVWMHRRKIFLRV